MPESSAPKTLLVTGGAGFIGSNFLAFALEEFPDTQFINLDKLTYAGSRENMADFLDHPRHTFIHGDICDKALVAELFDAHSFDGLIHFAAETHVDRSITAADEFIKTNIEGTYILLEYARRVKSTRNDFRFLHVSTDEVYGSLGTEGYFTETSPYAPNSPYSASKAASDHLVRSYHHTYGLDTLISHCSNNYGPRQNMEKLIPTILWKSFQGEAIPIYGDGSNVRDWLFVTDHCRAISKIYLQGRSGETYVIGARNEKSNLELAHEITSILDKISPKESGSYQEQIQMVTDRPGHDFRYAIDPAKLERELGWAPKKDFQEGLEETIRWYLRQYKSQVS